MSTSTKTKQTKDAAFSRFLKGQGLVGLAVGFLVGGAAKDFVNDLITHLIDPLIGWALGTVDLSEKTLTLVQPSAESAGIVLGWGQAVMAAINLIVVAFVAFFFVKKLHLEDLDKEK